MFHLLSMPINPIVLIYPLLIRSFITSTICKMVHIELQFTHISMVNTLKYLCGLVHNARPGRMTIYWCVLYNNGLRGPNACESGEVLYPTTTHTTIATLSVCEMPSSPRCWGESIIVRRKCERWVLCGMTVISPVLVWRARKPHRSGLPM